MPVAFVTGARGFVGLNLIDQLLAEICFYILKVEATLGLLIYN